MNTEQYGYHSHYVMYKWYLIDISSGKKTSVGLEKK